MQKVLMTIVLVGLWVGTVSAQGFWKELGKAAIAGLPKVDSPLLHQMGVEPHGMNMVVVNSTPYYGRVVVYGKDVARIGPGDSVYDDRHWESLNTQIPVLVLFYEDPGLTDYIGAAGRIFALSGYGYAYSQSWNISPNDIRTVGLQLARLPVAATPTSRQVKFPREWRNGTAGVQVLNNRLATTLIVRVNGQDRAQITTGRVFYLANRELGAAYGQSRTIQVIFLDQNGQFAGTAESSFYVPTQNVFAYQWIVGAHR